MCIFLVDVSSGRALLPAFASSARTSELGSSARARRGTLGRVQGSIVRPASSVAVTFNVAMDPALARYTTTLVLAEGSPNSGSAQWKGTAPLWARASAYDGAGRARDRLPVPLARPHGTVLSGGRRVLAVYSTDQHGHLVTDNNLSSELEACAEQEGRLRLQSPAEVPSVLGLDGPSADCRWSDRP